MDYQFPKIVKSNFLGYSCLIDYHRKTATLDNQRIILDFKNTEWFDGNLCAVLGAINEELKHRENTIHILNLNSKIKAAFGENLSYNDAEIKEVLVHENRIIRYVKLDSHEETKFVKYVEKFLSLPYLPNMSELLKVKINRSILEIFYNAVTHGKSMNICACGHYYSNSKKLDFTIVDLGHSIRRNVRRHLNDTTMSAKDAIGWATEKGNSTREANVPGGLGFFLIREFLKLNKGSLEIISSNGFWREQNASIFVDDFRQPFVGTIVNLEFNLADVNSYVLAEEINNELIF